MGRTASVLIAAIAVSAAALVDAHHDTQTAAPVRLSFADGADLTSLSIRYFLTGPFGGVGSFVRTQAGVREYDVETSHGGQAARTLEVLVYCPGHRMVTFSDLNLGAGTWRTLVIQLEPLGSLPFAGRLTGVANPERLVIEAHYVANWSHAFFGIVDGMVASFVVASATATPEGLFAIDLPDFARDPVVARYAEGESMRGSWRFAAQDLQTGRTHFLEATGAPQRRLAIAETYPGQVVFEAVVR